jgi:hypothetical protein
MSSPLTTEQNDEQTRQYLKTNGPPPGAFAPDVPAWVLEGLTQKEKYMMEMISTGAKQNEWLIHEVSGLKSAHRTIHSKMEQINNQFAAGEKRFQGIDSTLAPFTALRDKWLNRKALRNRTIMGLVSLLILPFFSLLLVEVAKHFLHWP